MPSFLSYFKTPSIGPTKGIEPVTSRSAHSSALPTELILPRFKLQVELRKKVRAIPRGKESCPGNTVEGKEI